MWKNILIVKVRGNLTCVFGSEGFLWIKLCTVTDSRLFYHDQLVSPEVFQPDRFNESYFVKLLLLRESPASFQQALAQPTWGGNSTSQNSQPFLALCTTTQIKDNASR